MSDELTSRLAMEPQRELAGWRVLVVEDEFYLADDMRRGLTAKGAEVLGPANTVDRAMALLDGEPVDFAVLDVNVRGKMIFPLAEELRRRAVPFVFTTGYGAEMIPPAFHDVPRWEKPFVVDALVRSLDVPGTGGSPA